MQVATNMTPAQAQAYQKYVSERAIRERENQQAQAQTEQHQAAAKARYQAHRLNQIHTAKQDYECECCGKTIPKGTQYRRQNIPVGFGFMEGTHFTQRITHLVCSMEATQ